jgi:hypothetical protein
MDTVTVMWCVRLGSRGGAVRSFRNGRTLRKQLKRVFKSRKLLLVYIMDTVTVMRCVRLGSRGDAVSSFRQHG